MILRIYTDGGCANNQERENIGGYGAVLEYGEHIKEIYGNEVNTTNNRMELMALISALKTLNREGLYIEIFSDSSYVMDCFRLKWYETWEKNGWKNSKKEPVENRELWEELLALVRKHNCTFYRVKGHVNLDSKVTNLDKLYSKFLEWNGNKFSFEDFKYITEKNNRCDELANIAMDELRR